MISLFSDTYNVTLEETDETKTPSATARIVRQATLDGGVAFEHLGVCHGDRTFKIRAQATMDQVDALRSMHEEDTLVYCALREGVFSGAIASVSDERGALEISFLVNEKIE